MNPLSIIGAFVITLSLLFYGISSIAIQRFKIITPSILTFITLGVLTDLTAITFMIIASDNGAFTTHGIIGYTAALTMIVDMILVWRIYIKFGFDSEINNSVLLYSKIAYGWWIIAYIAGSAIILWQ